MSLCQLLYCMQASSTDKLQCLNGMSPKQLGLTLVSNTRCQVSNSTFFLPHKKSRNIIFDCGVLCPKLVRFRYRSMKKLARTVDGIETVANGSNDLQEADQHGICDWELFIPKIIP